MFSIFPVDSSLCIYTAPFPIKPEIIFPHVSSLSFRSCDFRCTREFDHRGRQICSFGRPLGCFPIVERFEAYHCFWNEAYRGVVIEGPKLVVLHITEADDSRWRSELIEVSAPKLKTFTWQVDHLRKRLRSIYIPSIEQASVVFLFRSSQNKLLEHLVPAFQNAKWITLGLEFILDDEDYIGFGADITRMISNPPFGNLERLRIVRRQQEEDIVANFGFHGPTLGIIEDSLLPTSGTVPPSSYSFTGESSAAGSGRQAKETDEEGAGKSREA
ncbi:unnamed protein product [Linum trigynum]|uniref:Uncharacterized protein n=1 Tax=Linum trigynum TaxID=586398 RepID=A0AAV2GC87_9ROSI